MHKQIRALTLTGLLAAGLTASAVFAQDSMQQNPPAAQDSGQPASGSMGHMHRMTSPDQQLKHMTRQLNLSTDQQSQIKPILDDHQQQMQQMMQDQSMSKQDRRQKMRSLNQDTHSKIEAVLTDQQKQKWASMMQQHQQMHQQGMQDNGNPPPPSQQPQQ